MEAPEGGMLRWLEDGSTGGAGRLDNSDHLFLGLDDLGQRERKWTGRRRQMLTDISLEGLGPEEAEE
jgi:hypothetical protein